MSTKVALYYPQSVVLPKGIRRMVRINKNHINEGELDERDRSQYDSKTLFYDMFLSVDKRYLVCIGPPLLNLGHPIAIYYQGKSLKFSLKSGKYFLKKDGDILSFIYIRMPSVSQKDELIIHFQFVSFNLMVSYFPQPPIPRVAGKVALVTIQKDNPIIWIQDWCKWHRRRHNIGRVVIYDNGSKNLAELRTNLSQLDEDMEIILVHWPFPYGPICSHFNQYTQVGAINHCRLALCAKRSWLLNLDVDEYLYLRSRKSLIDYLNFKPYRSVIYLGCYQVPETQRHLGRLSRFFDYDTRLPDEAMNLLQGIKYIHWVRNIKYNMVHHVRLNSLSWGYWGRELKMRIGINPYISASKKMSKEVGFYHFRGLRTDWKIREYRKYETKPQHRPNPDTVLDMHIKDLAAKNRISGN